MKTKVYIVQGLGLGDDENAFENMCAFDSLALAEANVEMLKDEDKLEGFEIEYNIEVLDYQTQ